MFCEVTVTLIFDHQILISSFLRISHGIGRRTDGQTTWTHNEMQSSGQHRGTRSLLFRETINQKQKQTLTSKAAEKCDLTYCFCPSFCLPSYCVWFSRVLIHKAITLDGSTGVIHHANCPDTALWGNKPRRKPSNQKREMTASDWLISPQHCNLLTCNFVCSLRTDLITLLLHDTVIKAAWSCPH